MIDFILNNPVKIYFGKDQLGHLATELSKYGMRVLMTYDSGSTLDASKWIAAGAYVDFDTWDFFSKPITPEKALPLVTILTLSATGNEMDAGGVTSNPETQVKLVVLLRCCSLKHLSLILY